MYDDEEKDSTTAFRMDCKMSSINRRRCQDEKCERRGGGSTPSSEQDDVDGEVDRDDGLTSNGERLAEGDEVAKQRDRGPYTCGGQ